VLKDTSSLKTVCARTVPSVRPSYLGEYPPMVWEGTRLKQRRGQPVFDLSRMELCKIK
jgi:hypothetical protein